MIGLPLPYKICGNTCSCGLGGTGNEYSCFLFGCNNTCSIGQCGTDNEYSIFCCGSDNKNSVNLFSSGNSPREQGCLSLNGFSFGNSNVGCNYFSSGNSGFCSINNFSFGNSSVGCNNFSSGNHTESEREGSPFGNQLLPQVSQLNFVTERIFATPFFML